jgi:16S rRNA (guanine527-N7)-methyltransferase
VAALPILVEYASPLVSLGGVFVAWKGTLEDDEIERGAKAAVEVGLEPERVVEVEPYSGIRDRNLVVYRKSAPCPERYPRRPGMATKRPLA